MAKSALIVGASGLVGSHCLDLLLQEEAYERVTALVRRPLAIAHPKLTQHGIDFERPGERWDPIHGDDVFCCLGTTIKKAGSQEAFRRVDYDYPLQVAALARKNGARQFLIVTSLGANPHSPIFYSRVKGEVEESLRRIPFEAIHFFRPSLLLGERTEHRMGEKAGAIIMAVLCPLFIGPLRAYRAIPAETVARAMVRVAGMHLAGVHVFETDRIRRILEGPTEI